MSISICLQLTPLCTLVLLIGTAVTVIRPAFRTTISKMLVFQKVACHATVRRDRIGEGEGSRFLALPAPPDPKKTPLVDPEAVDPAVLRVGER